MKLTIIILLLSVFILSCSNRKNSETKTYDEFKREKSIALKEKNNDIKGALEECEELIDISPIAGYRTRAFIFVKLNRFDEAIKDMDDLIDEDPKREYVKIRSDVYEMAGRNEKAVEEMKKGMKLTMEKYTEYDYINMYVDLADFEVNAKKYEDAIINYSKYIDYHNNLNPPSAFSNIAEIYGKRSIAYFRVNNNEKGFADINYALKKDSTNAKLYNIYGTIYREIFKDNKNAIIQFSNTIRYDNSNMLGYYIRGLSYKDLNQIDSACKDFTKANAFARHKPDSSIIKATKELLEKNCY